MSIAAPVLGRLRTVPLVTSASDHAIKLEMVSLDKLHVDHAAEGGYARGVSDDRLRKLRKEWNLRKVGTIEVVQRGDKTLWLIDGQHRREVAMEQGVPELPAVVHRGLSVEEEADLYLGKADAFPQQALAIFAARLKRGDVDAKAIKSTVEGVGLRIGMDYGSAHVDDGTIVAIGRLERIYQLGRSQTLYEVLKLIKECWGIDHRAYQQAMLEAMFQFWATYHNAYNYDRLVERLKETGVEGISSRAYAIRAHGEWSRTVDSLVVALWRAYHEPKLRGHRLAPWTGKRTRLSVDAEGNVKTFAPGSRAARINKAVEERRQLSVVS